MMEVIHCEECGGSSIPLNSVSVDVVLTKSSWCEHCRESKHEKRTHFFCSLLCFNRHMIKMIDGEVENWTWKEYDRLTGQTID